MQKKRWLAILLTLVMILAMSIPAYAADNLITNGNFEEGNAGFTSQYQYVSATGWSTLQPPYKYAIGTDPYLYHSAWGPGFGDHTSGTGKMMIVNGTSNESGNQNAIVWQQNVALPAVNTSAGSYPLYAGQTLLVGEVLVKYEGSKILVKFVLNADAIAAGWLISEAHVAVGDDVLQIPNKNGNPIPGQFTINEKIDPRATETEWYYLDATGTAPYAIAAHAVVTKMDCVVNQAAPYGPDEVVNTLQGLRYDYSPVLAIRSNSAAALKYEGTQLAGDFYSLGFGPGDAIDDAYLTVRFNTPIINGLGADLQIVEDTWGLPYPVESCTVYASADGINWTSLGEANNQTPLPDGVHTYTDFDLGLLESASYIKVQDSSIRANFSGLAASQGTSLDGFDINAIIALQTNRTCTEYSETAWGGDKDFSGKNWATYIEFTPPAPAPTSYLLEFYAASSYSEAPAKLQVEINGDIVVPTLDLTSYGNWQKYSAVWNAPVGVDSADIIIRDTRYVYSGDDFCIDDISLIEKP